MVELIEGESYLHSWQLANLVPHSWVCRAVYFHVLGNQMYKKVKVKLKVQVMY